ncbi:hypothetical protein GCM10020295_30870 [Streptomyces cinereospinus]
MPTGPLPGRTAARGALDGAAGFPAVPGVAGGFPAVPGVAGGFPAVPAASAASDEVGGGAGAVRVISMWIGPRGRPSGPTVCAVQPHTVTSAASAATALPVPAPRMTVPVLSPKRSGVTWWDGFPRVTGRERRGIVVG